MEKDLLEKLIESGKSQREIAEELKLSQTTIKYWLKKYELKTIHRQYNKQFDDNKVCPRCETSKSIDEFYKRSNRGDYNGYCKKCSNEYHTERVKNVKIKMVEYKGCECIDCHLKLNDINYVVFDFHHLNPNEKDPNFDKIKYQKWDVIKNEINKCVLLCSNCHRIRHYFIRTGILEN